MGGGINPNKKSKTPYKAVVNAVHDTTGDGGIDLFDVAELFRNGENTLQKLKGDGDFRSEECIELLKESDIVVTNPPFSLFREYVAQLIKYDKKFLIIGNKNSITYKEVFPLIKENKVWIGATPMTKDLHFFSPREHVDMLIESGRRTSYVVEKGTFLTRSPSIWFTNLDHKKRHEPLILYKKYTPEEYPEYDNYDAIEVSKTKEIPLDYEAAMGVPITFLDKWNPEQFEIVGADFDLARPEPLPNGKTGTGRFYVREGGVRRLYSRLVIRRRK